MKDTNHTAPMHTQQGVHGQQRVMPPQEGYGPGPNAQPSGKRSKRRPLIAVGVVLLVLAAIYGGGVLFFSSHFFPNTTLNDQDLSFQPSESLASQIQSQADSYMLTISGEGFECAFDHDEVMLSIDPAAIANEAVSAQDTALWFTELFASHDISDVVTASYDQTALTDTLEAKVKEFNKDQDASEDARIVYDEDADAFTVEPEVYGTQLDSGKVLESAEAALGEMRTECELTDDDLIRPQVSATDPRTLEAAQKAGELFPNNVSLMLDGDVKAATIDKKLFASWLSINPEDFSLDIDKDELASWVDDKTSGMNTVGTKRTWTRADGKKCSVSGGSYGWKVDADSLADTVYDTLSKGGAKTIDIPCSQSGAVYSGVGERDWGAYVDVDLTQQKARYYDANDKLLHSCDIVSGKPTADRATPTGVYYLNSKASPSVLTGYKPNGEIDYETKVTYWMPFVGSSVGLHDATWQSSFGGSRYKTNGSHGCVNLSLSDAKWFYQNLNTGVCIITHN